MTARHYFLWIAWHYRKRHLRFDATCATRHGRSSRRDQRSRSTTGRHGGRTRWFVRCRTDDGTHADVKQCLTCHSYTLSLPLQSFSPPSPNCRLSRHHGIPHRAQADRALQAVHPPHFAGNARYGAKACHATSPRSSRVRLLGLMMMTRKSKCGKQLHGGLASEAGGQLWATLPAHLRYL